MSKPIKREPGSREIPKWEQVGQYSDIRYERAEGIAKITINRPEVRNAFRPETLAQLQEAFNIARDDDSVGVIIFTADNAKFGQTGPMVGSFDGGYGAGLLAAHIGQKKAREIWFMCRQYDAQEALEMGLVNTVVPVAELEAETLSWAREMLRHSPLALRLLKAGLNAADDGLAGVQQLAGDATLLFYLTEEGQEGRNAFQEKRPPNFGRFPKRP